MIVEYRYTRGTAECLAARLPWRVSAEGFSHTSPAGDRDGRGADRYDCSPSCRATPAGARQQRQGATSLMGNPGPGQLPQGSGGRSRKQSGNPLRVGGDHGPFMLATAIHVGGLEGELEDEAALGSLFGRFGAVLAVTLRVR